MNSKLFDFFILNCNYSSYLIFFLTIFLFYFLLRKKLQIRFGNNKTSFIFVILGPGGHSYEMLHILKQLDWHKFVPIYGISNTDDYLLSLLQSFENKFERNYFIERLIKPREHQVKLKSPFVFYKFLLSFFQCLKILYYYSPDFIIANGPNLCVPPIIAAYILRKLSLIKTKIIYIESLARVKSLSISAKLVKNFSDSMWGSWEDLCVKHQLTPLYSNNLSDITVITDKKIEKSKIVLMAVGSTEFSKLTKTFFSKEMSQFLYESGYEKLILQIGSIETYENFENMNINAKIKIEVFKFLPYHKFTDYLQKADLIIAHGGAGIIFQALSFGRKIIVVPNESLSENHQMELVNKMSQLDLIYAVKVENLLSFLFCYHHIISSTRLSQIKLNISNNFTLNTIVQKNKKVTIKNDCHNNLFSIVIPSRMQDIFLLKNLLLSLKMFLDISHVSNIFLIVPNKDFEEMLSLLAVEIDFFEIKLKLIKETVFVNEKDLKQCETFPKTRSGWFKSQLIKLAAAFYVETDFYLILDSDCILTKKMGYFDMFSKKNDKIFAYYQKEALYLHENWWKGSAKLLGMTSKQMETLNGFGMGVTPQILSKQIVQKMCDYLEASHPYKGKWYSILSCNRIQLFPIANWTEYTLYYLFAFKTKILNKYHIEKENILANYEECMWEIHKSYKWNPFNKLNTRLDTAFFNIFQSNTGLGHRIPKAFLHQYREPESNVFISCSMIFDSSKTNMMFSSIENFLLQTWPSKNREIIIFFQQKDQKKIENFQNLFKEQIKFIKTNNINNTDKIFDEFLYFSKGNYICSWPKNIWFSQYRLSIQFNYLIEQKIDACYISPFTIGFPYKNTFHIASPTEMKNWFNTSILQKKDIIIRNKLSGKQLSEPTIMIHIFEKEIDEKIILSNFNKIKTITGSPQLNELTSISNSFIQSKNSTRKQKIYFLSSELEFKPIIGGINTFLRAILSEIKNCYSNPTLEFVFCGIQCGEKIPETPNIKGVSFKFFQLEKSKNSEDLESYFKSFDKFSSTLISVEDYGKQALLWILSDAKPDDICITTIIYENDVKLLSELKMRGIKIIHTVHSLVAIKALCSLRNIPFSKLDIKDKLKSIFGKFLNINENKIMRLSKTFCLRWILPSIFLKSLEKEKITMSLAQVIFVPSRKLAEKTAMLYPDIKHKIRYVPWGLPEGEMIGDYQLKFEKNLIPIMDQTNQKIKCLAMCKISSQKGIDLLLNSFIYLESIDPRLANHLELNICGDVSYADQNSFYKSIEQKVSFLKRVKVNFYGWIQGKEKYDQMKQSHIFLSSSLTEPFGFSLLECMKIGIPVVSFKTEGPQDIILYDFGRLIPITTNYDDMTKDFARAIVDICYSSNYNEMREKAFEASRIWTMRQFFENLEFMC